MEPRSKKDQRWIVKEAEGKIWGPYTTEQVLAQIERGYYVGGEQVAAFPGGTWVAISKSPEFYDRLLDVLASEGKNAQAAAKSEDTVATAPQEPTEKIELIPVPSDVAESRVTEINRTHGLAEVGDYTDRATAPVVPPTTAVTSQTNRNTSLTNRTQANAAVMELTDLKHLEEKEEGRSDAKVAFYFILAAVVLAAVAFLMTDEEKVVEGNRIHLLAPKRSATALAESAAKAKVTRAMQGFVQDTFSGYQRAQNELVEVIQAPLSSPEAAPARAERLAALCLTYRELWPYSYQDSKDLKTVGDVMQEAKRLDPGGKNGATCEIVQLMLSGRMLDAQGLTDSMLVEDSQTPVLF